MAQASPSNVPRQWPQSRAVNLLFAGVVGFLHALFMMGPGPLNPKNISWLQGDAADYFIAWSFFRQDPHFHWPITFTDQLSYPLGDSIAFMDPIPILAVFFKPFSPLLPTPFQYLGIAAILACALQFFFAALLFRKLLGGSVLSVLLPSLFLLFAAPMNWRLVGHYALANHWLILAAFCLCLSLQRTGDSGMRNVLIAVGVLSAVSAGVNPYLSFMTVSVILAGLVTAVWQRRMSGSSAGLVLGTMLLACLLSAFTFGLLRGGGGYTGEGYRTYSMNLLALFDAREYGSLLFRKLPWIKPQQIEGFSFLGTGILGLALTLLPSLRALKIRRAAWAQLVPITVCSLIFFALALSTRVTAGKFILVDLDPREYLTPLLSTFRASGRLVWLPYYVIVTLILVAAFSVWKPKMAATLVAIAGLLQASDLLPMRRWIQDKLHEPATRLHSPIWASLGKEHRNLIVLPAYECNMSTPGGVDGFRIFGLLALAQHMRTNSYYAARYSPEQIAYHCDKAEQNLLTTPLDAESAYVVSPAAASAISDGPTGANACHTVDEFILCSTRTSFGLPPEAARAPFMYESGQIESWSDAVRRGFLVGGWYYPEETAIWNRGTGSIRFRLTDEQRRRYNFVSLSLAIVLGSSSAHYTVRSGVWSTEGTYPGSAKPTIAVFQVNVPLQAGADGIQTIDLTRSNPLRPIALGLGDDPRVLGLSLSGVKLVPRAPDFR